MRINCTPTPRRDGKPEPDDIDRLSDAATRVRGLQALYLFGSGATGKLGPRSDLDIAITIDPQKRSTKPKRMDPVEHSRRIGAVARARERGIETALRKAIGWRRAIDFVFLAPHELNRGASADDFVHGIRTQGLRPVINGEQIPFTQAAANGPPAPGAEPERPVQPDTG